MARPSFRNAGTLVRPLFTLAAGVLVIALVAWGVVAGWRHLNRTTLYAEFDSATGIYEGDPVKILGVDVGTVASITPGVGSTRIEMKIDHDVQVPANAGAMLVAPSLVSGRFIQLTPAYKGGDEIVDGTTITNTVVPVEWDEIKRQLTQLSVDLSPKEGETTGTLGRFVDAADQALDGNGETFNSALRELSRTAGVFGDHRRDVFGTVTNLQLFASALSNSHDQMRQLNRRMAAVGDLLDTRRGDLATALTDLDAAIVDLQRFTTDHRAELTESVGRLQEVTGVLAAKRPELERILHVAPTAMVNFYNIYRPAQGTLNGALTLNQFVNPVNFICAAIEGVANETSRQSAQLCAQFLGPMLATMAMNHPNILLSPPVGVGALPNQVEYSEPGLRPGGSRAVPTADVQPFTESQSTSRPRDLAGLLLPGGNR